MDQIFQNCIKLVKNKSLSGIKLSKFVKKHVSSFEMRESIVTFCAPMKTERLFSLVNHINKAKLFKICLWVKKCFKSGLFDRPSKATMKTG